MDLTKLTGIKDWIPPKTVKGVRSFLEISNFYQRFIGNYTEIAKPMVELTKKTKFFEWSQECQMGFENLKKFLEKPILIIPDPSKQFFIDMCCTGMNVKVHKTRNKDQVPWEKP